MDSDLLVERQRSRRGLRRWRAVALILAVVLALGLFAPGAPRPGADHIATLEVTGLLVADLPRARALRAAAEDPRTRALILYIDSPGGTVVGGEELYRVLAEIAGQKPVAVVMGTTATSAAYMAALGGSRIFARAGSITGSIGVILQSADITPLLARIGIVPEAIKSDPLKAVPNPLEPLTPAGRAAAQALVDDMHDQFVGLVAAERALSAPAVRTVADGRVFSGRQALELGLVDALGDGSDAERWIQATLELPALLPTRELTIERPDRSWLRWLLTSAEKVLSTETLTLDGLVSLWHPDLR